MSSGRPPGKHHNCSTSDTSARSTSSVSNQHHRCESQWHSNAMDPSAFSSMPAGKVAIPPLHPRPDPAPSTISPEKKRTSKACVECRLRKIKCSGKRPTCEHCEQCGTPCVYADGKREQNKRATERSDRLLQLVRDIAREAKLPSHLLQKIQDAESEVVDDDVSLRSAQTGTSTKRRRKSSATATTEKRPRSRSPPVDQGEAGVSADVGSEESVDLAAEDFNRTEKTKATGFMGKNSEVSWAQRLHRAQADGKSRTGPYGKPGDTEDARKDRMAATQKRQESESKQNAPVANFNYHLDTESILTLDHVDKDEVPPLDIAKRLLQCYLHTVQDSLPILAKSDIIAQFQQYARTPNPASLPSTWRAILNMVFAIGAKFSHLINATWRGDERDHFIYYTRAINLSLPGDAVTAHPDLQRIQVLGLISFYYLTISQVSRYVDTIALMRGENSPIPSSPFFVEAHSSLYRSWVMVGLAYRQAIALGLHLRNIDTSINAFAKEKRIKVWWSLYYIEYLLCEITGRPTSIDHRFCSVPPPAPVEETNLDYSPGVRQLEEWNRSQGISESPSSGSRQLSIELENAPSTSNYFRCRVQLAVLSQKIFINLYSASTITKSWEQAQEQILTLGEEVDQWYTSLPIQFQFARTENVDQSFSRERILLGFGYYSAKILLNRPCLCRVDQRIHRQGEKSKSIDMDRARECVMAARSICDLLPDMDVPDVHWVYTKGPWWCIIHHLMQAMTVLMLELAFEVCHMADPTADQEAIIVLAKKLLRWLTMMAALGHEGARSACKQARDQFKGFSLFETIDTSDLIRMAEYGPDLLRQQLASKDEVEPKQSSSKAQSLPVISSTSDVARGASLKQQSVWLKMEQLSAAQSLEDAKGFTADSTFQQKGVPEPQEALLSEDLFQQTSQEPWPDFSNDQAWDNSQWDTLSHPTWNTGVLQTSYDLNNPLPSFAGSLPAHLSPAGPTFSIPHHMAGINATAYAEHYVDPSQVGSTAGPSDATLAQAEQQHQQGAMGLGGHTYPYPPSSQHQTQHQDQNHQPHEHASEYPQWPPYMPQQD